MANEDKKQVPAEVVALAKHLETVGGELEVKGEAATSEVAAEHYVKFMSEGSEVINEKLLREIQDKNETWNAGVGLFGGNKAVTLFTSDKNVKDVNVVSKLIGRDTFNVNVKREVEVRAPGSDEVSTQYGVISTALKSNGARHKVGSLSIVRDQIKEAALAAYGK